MEVLQYIYTSWKNGNSSEKGYMIYSRSEGLSDEECTAIKDSMQYLAPKELPFSPTEQEINDIFPFSFAYFILPTGRGCIAQSTYLGKDYSGRYGNYIIYAMVFDIDSLPVRAAECFGEPYIKTFMTEEELNAESPVPPLPVLNIEDFSDIINDNGLYDFLYDKEEEFALLIQSVLAARDAGVPFYLNDTRENLVLWAAAMQRILPPELAKRFTFNTYVGDHEFMRSARVRDQGIEFYITGVRPDANFFNYSTESASGRHIVLDFLGGNASEGVIPGSFAQTMAQSIISGCIDIDEFGEFLENTSFSEINGQLDDAFLFFRLLKYGEFNYSEKDTVRLISFGKKYCSEYENSDVAGKIISLLFDSRIVFSAENISALWKYVCDFSSYLKFTLYEYVTYSFYDHVQNSDGDYQIAEKYLDELKRTDPYGYGDYLDYLNTDIGIEGLSALLLSADSFGDKVFCCKWLISSYPFVNGLEAGRMIDDLLKSILTDMCGSSGNEDSMIDILFETVSKRSLFESVINLYMVSIKDPLIVDGLCASYVRKLSAVSTEQQNLFEHYLFSVKSAAPLAIRLSADKISHSRKPEEDFWSLYNKHRSLMREAGAFTFEPMIIACLKNCMPDKKGAVAERIIAEVDQEYINDGYTIRLLTDALEEWPVKALSKLSPVVLQKACKLRMKTGDKAPEKLNALLCVKALIHSDGRLDSCKISELKMSLEAFDKNDYEFFVKTYMEDFFSRIKDADDVVALIRVFSHSSSFDEFLSELISMLKKAEKKEYSRWIRIVEWISVYALNASSADLIAVEVRDSLVRYLKNSDDDNVDELKKRIASSVPEYQAERFFDEIRHKDGFQDKIGNIFRRGKK